MDKKVFTVVITALLLNTSFTVAETPSKSEDFALSPENENNQSDILADDFSECTQTKRFQECIGSIQASIIFGAGIVFVLTLCCTLICCKVCFDRRERKRKRREDLCQGYAAVPDFDATQNNDLHEEFVEVHINNSEALHCEDHDPPPDYPGLLQAENHEDEPPPYSPSFRRSTVLDTDFEAN